MIAHGQFDGIVVFLLACSSVVAAQDQQRDKADSLFASQEQPSNAVEVNVKPGFFATFSDMLKASLENSEQTAVLVNQNQVNINARFDTIDRRLDALDQRMASVVESFSSGLQRLEKRFSLLREKVIAQTVTIEDKTLYLEEQFVDITKKQTAELQRSQQHVINDAQETDNQS